LEDRNKNNKNGTDTCNKYQTIARQTQCSSGYSRKKRSVVPKVRWMKRICEKITDNILERHRGMAIRNCQTSINIYTQTLLLLEKYTWTGVIYGIGMTYFVLRIWTASYWILLYFFHCVQWVVLHSDSQNPWLHQSYEQKS
jgi:hypothetical protein